MYVRTTTRHNQDGTTVRYVHLAHNHRDPVSGHSTAKLVYNFGREDELDLAAVRRLVDSLSRLLPAEDAFQAQAAAADSGLKFVASRSYGGAWAVAELWQQLGIGSAIDRALAGREFRTDVERAIFAMVANRCLAPSSKLGVEGWVANEVALPGVEEVAVHQLYRAMDALLDAGDQIAEQVFFQVANLLNLEVDLLFFDTTSTYFEMDQEDEFCRRGHSKDHRWDLPQVVIGLAVTKEGLPVRCWVWPGNTTDVSVIEEVRRDLRQWKLGRVVTVCDRGFVSEENLAAMQRGGGHYITGERLRSGKDSVVEALQRPGRFKKVRANLELKEVIVGEGARQIRYVLVRNPERAARDQAKRESILTALGTELEHLAKQTKGRERAAATLLGHKAYRRYLTQNAAGVVRIDPAKVKAEAKLDGKFLLRSSDDTLSPEDIALGYRQLHLVESAFRTLKQRLDLRPVFHRLEDRIRAHVLLCWLGLMVVRVAENRCGQSWAEIEHCLGQMQLGQFAGEHGTALLRTATNPDQKRLFAAMGVAEPPIASQLRA